MSSVSEEFKPDRTGLLIIAGVSVVSAIAVGLLLGHFIYLSIGALVNAIRGRRSSDHAYVSTGLGLYTICLFLSNASLAVAGLIEFFWLGNPFAPGAMCNTQSVFVLIGILGGAYFFGAVALHSFITLVLRKSLPTWTSWGGTILGWGLVIFVAVDGRNWGTPDSGSFYAPSVFWCWISRPYTFARFFLLYFPILMAALVASALYAIIYLACRGVIRTKGAANFDMRKVQRWNGHVAEAEDYQTLMAVIAKCILWYPIAFVLLLAPVSILGLLDIGGQQVSQGAAIFSGVAAELIGVVNVIIYLNTRRVMRRSMRVTSTIASTTRSFSPSATVTTEKIHSPIDMVCRGEFPSDGVPPMRVGTDSGHGYSGSGHTPQSSISSVSSRQVLTVSQHVRHTPQSSISSVASRQVPTASQHAHLPWIGRASPPPLGPQYQRLQSADHPNDHQLRETPALRVQVANLKWTPSSEVQPQLYPDIGLPARRTSPIDRPVNVEPPRLQQPSQIVRSSVPPREVRETFGVVDNSPPSELSYLRDARQSGSAFGSPSDASVLGASPPVIPSSLRPGTPQAQERRLGRRIPAPQSAEWSERVLTSRNKYTEFEIVSPSQEKPTMEFPRRILLSERSVVRRGGDAIAHLPPSRKSSLSASSVYSVYSEYTSPRIAPRPPIEELPARQQSSVHSEYTSPRIALRPPIEELPARQHAPVPLNLRAGNR